MRVSDADRAEVADQLAHHYGEGRLDQEEFNRRLDQAMAARTYRDLAGLLTDLPQPPTQDTLLGPPDAISRLGRRTARRSPLRTVVLGVLIALLLLMTLHTALWAMGSAIWLAMIVAIVVVVVHARSRHR